AGAARLQPVLDGIERSARELKALRVHGDPAQLASLEPVILTALREVEAGNTRFDRLIGRVVEGGVEFESLMAEAQQAMTELEGASSALPAVAARLEASHPATDKLPPALADDPLLADLFAQYTMEHERDVHREVLQRFGLAAKSAMRQVV